MTASNHRLAWFAAASCCANPGPQPPAGIPPTIRFATIEERGGELDPPQNSGAWLLQTPLQSEANLFGKWHDPDNDPTDAGGDGGAFIQFFRVSPVDGSLNELTGQPGNNLLPGDVFSDMEQDWSIDLVGVDYLEWEGATIIAQITDIQGNVAQAQVVLEIKQDDPLREIPGHPRPRQSRWNWGMRPGATPPPGYQVQGPTITGFPPTIFGVPSPWEVGASIGTPGVALTMYGEPDQGPGLPTTVGTHYFDMRVLFADEFSELKVYVEFFDAQGNVYDEFEETFTGPVFPGQNEDVQRPEDTNIHPISSSSYYSGPTFGGEIEEIGGGITIYLQGTYNNGADTTQNLPFWEFTDTNFDPAPVQPAPPPATETTIFEWDSSNPDVPFLWANLYANLAINNPGSQGRPQSPATSFSNGIQFSPGYRFIVPRNYEMPIFEIDGMLAQRYDPYQDLHNQVTISGIGGAWDAYYLRPQRTYRWEMTFTLSDEWTLSQWRDSAWIVLADFHPGTFGGSWSDSQSPPIGLYIDSPNSNHNQFVMRVNGSTQTTPSSYTLRQYKTLPMGGPGTYTITCQFHIDYRQNGNGYARFWVDQQYGGELRQEVGINAGGFNEAGSLFPKIGCYASGDASTVGAKIKYTSMRMVEIDEF